MCVHFFLPLFTILSQVFNIVSSVLDETWPWHWLAKLEKQTLQLDKKTQTNATTKVH